MISIGRRDQARRVNRALHEARRPLQRLALRGSTPAEVGQIAAALEEIDAAVNGVARPLLLAPAELRRARLAAAIENILVNALEHGTGPIEIIATPGDEATLVIRNRTLPEAAISRGHDPRRGHGLEVVARVARQTGGSFELRSDGARAVATLGLGSDSLSGAER